VTEPEVGPETGPETGPEVGPETVAAPGGAAVQPPLGGAEVRPAPGGGGTGHTEVDAALAELGRAERLPPDQQIVAYESVHRTLQDTLRTIEQS
jgi:hypothetical protein